MSKRINVNPDHYKVAGRERQGEDIVHSIERKAYAQQQVEIDRWQARRPTPKNNSGPVEPPARVEREPIETTPTRTPPQRARAPKAPPKRAARRRPSTSAVPRRAAPNTPAPKRNVVKAGTTTRRRRARA